MGLNIHDPVHGGDCCSNLLILAGTGAGAAAPVQGRSVGDDPCASTLAALPLGPWDLRLLRCIVGGDVGPPGSSASSLQERERKTNARQRPLELGGESSSPQDRAIGRLTEGGDAPCRGLLWPLHERRGEGKLRGLQTTLDLYFSVRQMTRIFFLTSAACLKFAPMKSQTQDVRSATEARPFHKPQVFGANL